MASTGQPVESFHLGTYVQATSAPHGIDQRFLVSKISIRLLSPAENRMTLGGSLTGLAGAVAGFSHTQGTIIQSVEKTAQKANTAIYNVEQNLLSSIKTSEDNIKSTVAETYTLKEDTNSIITDVRTEITQTKESYDIQFTRFRQDIDSVAEGTDAEFEEIRKYIRFVDGKILQDGAEVAYFSNRKLYVTDTQILHSLQLGSFAFMPRDNGNLSFKKI